MNVNKVTIIGVGLIGASFALALKKNNIGSEIVGSGRTESNLKEALNKGIIDSYDLDHREACRDADLIVLATPVGCFKDIISNIKPSLNDGVILIDVGSTKANFISALEAELPEGVSFVGTHPIAGSDRSGIGSSSADLFEGSACILIETGRTDAEVMDKVESIWEKIGARTSKMSADKHDRVFSSVSHLPHLVAYALVRTVTEIDPEYIKYAGQGFKDTTRIAMSSPELWADVFNGNKVNIKEQLDILIDSLKTLRDLAESDDKAPLISLLNDIRISRATIE
ncbi:MAG: prephenate dehydrogenase/arogenate dehydrogenase family protein [Nitrospirota bacterium]|nr:MAG: prephenate dehydrogenase/arogenate dehydrogenase family protein [Nitrospirota bacterium]